MAEAGFVLFVTHDPAAAIALAEALEPSRRLAVVAPSVTGLESLLLAEPERYLAQASEWHLEAAVETIRAVLAQIDAPGAGLESMVVDARGDAFSSESWPSYPEFMQSYDRVVHLPGWALGLARPALARSGGRFVALLDGAPTGVASASAAEALAGLLRGQQPELAAEGVSLASIRLPIGWDPHTDGAGALRLAGAGWSRSIADAELHLR